MRTRPGARPADVLTRLAGVVLLAFGMASPAGAQPPAPPPPPPAAPLAAPTPIIPTDPPRPSLVFPDGGFPLAKPAPEGGIPAAATKPGPDGADLPLPPADYAPPGGVPRDDRNAPVVDTYGGVDLYRIGLAEAASTRPGVGTVPVADYAPPGYFPREQQDTPGVPEYTPVPPPVPVTPEERLRYVVRGIAPGSYLAPGTNTSFRFRGFVRLTGMYDLSPIGSRDSFVPNTIPVPQQHGENANFTARPSRFTLESWTPTTVFDWNVHTLIEGDFFNGLGQAAGGGGNPFRLRFAFVDFGYFRVGQQNTVFMDAQTWPTLVDFQGPAGWVNQRRPGARVTVPLADTLFWAGGVEQPFADLTTKGRGDNVQDVPDFATHVRYEADLGHAQVSGLARSIGYRPADGSVTRRTGYGISAGGVYHPWAALAGTNPVRDLNPSGLTRSRVIGQYTAGWGIARYIQDTVGQGLDGVVDPTTGGLAVPYVSGWLASYEHWFSEKWLSSVTYSQTLVGGKGGQTATTYRGGKYLAANVWYIPVRNVSIGGEYMYGQRKNLDDQRGDAHRLQLLFQYNF